MFVTQALTVRCRLLLSLESLELSHIHSVDRGNSLYLVSFSFRKELWGVSEIYLQDYN